MRSHGMLQRQLALATALAITAHAAMAAPAASSQPWQCNRTIKSPIIGTTASAPGPSCHDAVHAARSTLLFSSSADATNQSGAETATPEPLA